MPVTTIVSALADIRMLVGSPVLGEKSVDFELCHKGHSSDSPVRILVSDSRPIMVKAAKAAISMGGDRHRREGLLSGIFQRPALVEVKKEISEKGACFYVHLACIHDQEPSALFSLTRYVRNCSAGFRVLEDKSIWSLIVVEPPPPYASYTTTLIIALTNDVHRIVVEGHGALNIGYSDQQIKVIGASISSMSREDFARGL